MSNYLGRDLGYAIRCISENNVHSLKVNRVRAARDDLNDTLRRIVPRSEHHKFGYLELMLSYAEQGKWTDVKSLKDRGLEEYDEVLIHLESPQAHARSTPNTSRSTKDPKEARKEILKGLTEDKFRQTPDSGLDGRTTARHDPLVEEAMVKLEEEIADLKEKLNEVVAERQAEEESDSGEEKAAKLAQWFTDVYKHEWVEAYDTLKSTFKTDEKIIRTLSQYLRMAFEYAADMVKQQVNNITKMVLCPDGRTLNKAKVSVDVYSTAEKKAKELQRESVDLSVHSVGEGFIVKNKSLLHDNYKFRRYIAKCVELAWLFQFEDPQPFPLWEIDGTESKDYLRPFTKDGKRIRCQVWPTLLLHENGPVIAKGTVLYY